MVNVSCASASPATPLLVHVVAGTSLSYLELKVEGHVFEIMASDGLRARARNPVQQRLPTLELNSGERMDVLLWRNDSSAPADSCSRELYRISVRSMYRPNQPQLYGILRYVDASSASGPLPSSSSFPMPPTPSEVAFPSTQVPVPSIDSSPLAGLVTMDAEALEPSSATSGGRLPDPDVRLLLVTHQERMDGGRMRWTINGVANMVPPTPSYMLSLLNYIGNGTSISGSPVPITGSIDLQDTSTRMINVALGSYVEVVLQNSVALNGVCEQHSWHLHGFHVVLIGRGVGTFRSGIDNASFMLNASQVLY